MYSKFKLFYIGIFFSFFKVYADNSKAVEEKDAPFIIDIIRAITGTSKGEDLPDFILFLGHFHPLVLHLPIGIIFAIFCLELFIQFYKGKKEHILAFKKVSFFLSIIGGISGIMSTTLGWLIASSLSYNYDSLALHGYVCTAFSILFFLLAYLRFKEMEGKYSSRPFQIILVVNLLLLQIGGHEGGNLTHGEEFLFKHAPDFIRKASGRKAKDIKVKGSKDSEIYGDLIVSLMNKYCLSCHSEVKVKGELRLDSYEAMLKEGEVDGPALTPGSLNDSAIYYRITIDPKDDPDDEIMPPKGKPQLSKEQIELIRWWITIGAPKKGKVKEYKPSDKIISIVEKEKIVLKPVLPKTDSDKKDSLSKEKQDKK